MAGRVELERTIVVFSLYFLGVNITFVALSAIFLQPVFLREFLNTLYNHNDVLNNAEGVLDVDSGHPLDVQVGHNDVSGGLELKVGDRNLLHKGKTVRTPALPGTWYIPCYMVTQK